MKIIADIIPLVTYYIIYPVYLISQVLNPGHTQNIIFFFSSSFVLYLGLNISGYMMFDILISVFSFLLAINQINTSLSDFP